MGEDAEFIDRVQQKRQARMAKVDQFDPATRTLIHEYGLNVVTAFVELGIVKPRHIKHLVGCVLDEFSPTRGSYSRQGIRTEVATTGGHNAD